MRRSGILLPVSALPGPYGIGQAGRYAYNFIDFLAEAGQKLWQILPVGQTFHDEEHLDSPYKSPSAFAFNPYLIDLDDLEERSLLKEDEIRAAHVDAEKVDYDELDRSRINLLRCAKDRFDFKHIVYIKFVEENLFWLKPYTRFMTQKLGCDDDFWTMVQFLFFDQWMTVKRYANEKGIMIVGDMPLYLSPESVETLESPELFAGDGLVAGCPPDDFAPEGQYWGSPLYNWKLHAETDFEWWIRRIKHMGKMFDIIRLDHFRGLASYFAIPAGKSPSEGEWMKGPGKAFIAALKVQKDMPEIIAEDLGKLDNESKELLKFSGYPGMEVIQFTPHKLPKKNSVFYTGTHDNDTLAGWAGDDAAPGYIKRVMYSRADTAIVQMQDWLSLGSDARMNEPGTLTGNWKWRVPEGSLTEGLAKHIYEITRKSRRI